MSEPHPQEPGHRSRFGGFWTDRLDAAEQLRARHAAGAIDDAQRRLLEQWNEQGFVVLERAVPEAAIDEFNADIERVWESGHPRIYTDYYENGERFTIPIEPRHRAIHLKVIDVYPHIASSRPVMFAEPVLAFLRLLFERDPMAFQSLYFRLGSMQSMHQDTAYVWVEPPMEFVGCWVALEDVQPDSGELEYYVGSHRLDEFLWDGAHKWMPAGSSDHQRYLDSLHEQATRRGLARVRFRPRKGDVLVWNADLVHGGAQQVAPGVTRKSLVTHFCPVDRQPAYFAFAKHSGKIRDASGGYYCFAYRWTPDADEVQPAAYATADPGAPAPRRPASRLRRLWDRITSP